jgi:hypothetical protein
VALLPFPARPQSDSHRPTDCRLSRSPRIRTRTVSAQTYHLPCSLNQEALLCCANSPQESRPSMVFLFVALQICRWLPPDPSSRKRPCLKLEVVISRNFSFIWMLVLLQRTFTSLVLAHAGRTQFAWNRLMKDVGVLQRLFTAAQAHR